MAKLTVQQAFDRALQHHHAGRLQEAENLYRHILSHQPRHADAMHLLGVIATQTGRGELALNLIRGAVTLRRDWPEAQNSLGNALKDRGQLDEAITAYRQAIALRPEYAEAHYGLGNVLKDEGKLDEAIACHRQAIALNSGFALAHSALGDALKDKGQLDEAIAAFRRALALNPHLAGTHSNLGNALRDNRQLDEAIAAYRQAIALNPRLPEAYANLGGAMEEKGQVEEAITAYRQAITLRPGYVKAHNNLGCALKSDGQLEEAIVAFRQAIALDANFPEAHNNLGSALKDVGQLDEAITAYRRAISLKPGYAIAHSNLLLTLQYHPQYDASAIADEHRRWSNVHAEPLKTSIQSHANDPNPDRRLRIGYVSPDFRQHVVGRNVLPLFSQHDHELFEITCYADVARPDAVTSQFQQLADTWRNVVGVSDEQLADQIRQDRIDILVDLAVHLAGNRLMAFARKPAPVQVTFAGYPGSTGMSAIDYRLSDPYLDPIGMDGSVQSEKTFHLADSFWCYDPQNGREILVNPLPALSAGVFTFGCLNNFCKVNDDVLALWAKVLRQVENSRLLLLAPPGNHRLRAQERMRQEEINPERVEFVSHQSRLKYLQTYHRIDLGLDTFPYNGHSTSLDSFWMGVPVVTLIGNRAVGRAGWCQLSNLGLKELAGKTTEQFVHLAVELAKDLPRLSYLRSTSRQRMEQSPLMDPPRFARNIEAAYGKMWRNWCESR